MAGRALLAGYPRYKLITPAATAKVVSFPAIIHASMLQFYCNYCMILWFSSSVLSLNRTVGIVSDIGKLNCTKLLLDTFLCISTTWHIMWNIFALKSVQYLIVRADWVERPRICQHITWLESLEEAQLLFISFKYVLHGVSRNLNYVP